MNFSCVQVPDGANCITTGYLGTLRNPVVLVGGNCSIQGYDHEGKDVFWTVSATSQIVMRLGDSNLGMLSHTCEANQYHLENNTCA